MSSASATTVSHWLSRVRAIAAALEREDQDAPVDAYLVTATGDVIYLKPFENQLDSNSNTPGLDITLYTRNPGDAVRGRYMHAATGQDFLAEITLKESECHQLVLTVRNAESSR
jgi:hypothetical protein